MDAEDNVLDLSDVVHDDTIADDADPGSPVRHQHSHESRSPEFDHPTSLLSPLHDTYNVSEHSSNHISTPDYSVEMLEREIATLLHQNASAASAALLNAAAQQRQANLEISRGSNASIDGGQSNANGIQSLAPSLSGLVAVLQAMQTRGVSEQGRDSLPKEQAPTRTAPAFHSLTASDSQDDSSPRKKRRGAQNGSDGSAYLFSEDEHASDGENIGGEEEAVRSPSQEHEPSGSSSVGNPINDLPPVSVSGEFSDINDILSHFSAQFDPDASHPSPHSLSTPDASPVISHSRPVETEQGLPPSTTQPPAPTGQVSVLVPSNRQDTSQPIASTSTSPPTVSESPTKKSAKRTKDKEKGPNQHVCDHENCHKSFTRRSDLARHMRIHTGERPFVCTYGGCGKTFIQRSALHVHSRVHTGEKPHCCEYPACGKTFGDSSSLARHRRTHTGKRPYKCQAPTCEKTFTRRTTLTTHMRTHDPNWEPDPTVKYNFKGKKRKLDDDDEQDLVESVRTISALFQTGDPSGTSTDPHVPFEAQVASISAEIAAAIAQAQSRAYDDDEEDEDEDDEGEEESGSGQEMAAPETIGPNTSGIRGLSNEAGSLKTLDSATREEDEDSDTFPQPLRARKSKETLTAAGIKRKR